MGRLGAKLSIEAKRLKDRLDALITWPLEPYQLRRHDRAFAANARQTPGQQPLRAKVAIFLIYQPKGLLRSVVETCRRLADAGYSVLVMSNAELSQIDHSSLAPLVWRVVERPNFGYDFGGYRDSVRVLREMGVRPNALIILNDSIWWPVFDSDCLIARMEAAEADVVGTILHHLPPRYGKSRSPFLESYFYWFGQKSLASSAFWRFWDNYRVSSLKYNAIRRGERKLTGVLLSAGLTAKGLFTAPALISAIRAAGPEEQVRVLTYAAFIDGGFAKKASILLASETKTSDWSEAVLAFVAEVTEKRIFHPTFPYASIKLLGANYLKKTPAEPKTSVHYLMRERVLTAIAAGDLPAPLAVVKAEIEQRQLGGAIAVGR